MGWVMAVAGAGGKRDAAGIKMIKGRLLMFRLMVASAMLVTGFSGSAWAGDAAVMKPIRQMEKGFNAGDVAMAKAAHVAMPDIVDEFGAPFHWSGKGAFDRWLAGLMRAEKAKGKSDGVVALGEPVRESVDGATAYVVTPSTYTFQQHGKTMRETGTITFVLAKGKAGWKISAWTWTSPEGVPVG